MKKNKRGQVASDLPAAALVLSLVPGLLISTIIFLFIKFLGERAMLQGSVDNIYKVYGPISASLPISILSLILSVTAIILVVFAKKKVGLSQVYSKKLRLALIFGIIGALLVMLMLFFLRRSVFPLGFYP